MLTNKNDITYSAPPEGTSSPSGKSSHNNHNNGHHNTTTTMIDNNNNNNNNNTTTHDDDREMQSSAGLTKLVLVAATTAATLGYDVGIMAAAIQPLVLEMELSSIQKELAMGSLNFVAALGALVGGAVAHHKGRKPTVTLCSWIFVIGTLCMALAPGYELLLLGRIITGLGVGISFVVAPVYLSEVAPSQLRGSINTVFDVAINGGILLGYIVGFLVQLLPLPEEQESYKWRLMLGLGLVLPIIVLCCLTFLPESPRWLVMDNQPAAASAVLQNLGCSPRLVDQTIASIQEELSYETTKPSICCGTWSKGMKLAVALGFWQQVTGTEAILYYSADFLEHAGLASPSQRLLGNVFVGLCKLTPELFAMRVVDTVGRRPLILGSAIALMMSSGLLSVAFFMNWSPLIVVLLLCAVMASFSIGLGPFTFLVAAESLGLSERTTGVTLCAAANRCTSGLVALTSVSMYEAMGSSGFFAFYTMVGLLSLPFYYSTVPETTGHTLEELAARNRGNHTPNPHHHHHVDADDRVQLNAELA